MVGEKVPVRETLILEDWGAAADEAAPDTAGASVPAAAEAMCVDAAVG